MSRLTSRQAEILTLIRDTIRVRGIPPTRAEIAREMGLRSVTTVVDHLRALAHKGVIELEPDTSRGIRLTDTGLALLDSADTPDPASATLPLIGQVAAGVPIMAEAHIEARFHIDPRLFRPRADYLLRVRGSSMNGAGILDGDYLAVHHTPEARSGQIVVARLDDEVTVKRFRRRGALVQLLPENPRFAPIEIDLRRNELVIEGLGVGVIRKDAPG